MIGLSDKTDIKEKIVKIDETKAIRYKVVEERIDLRELKFEKETLEIQLSITEPTDEELIEMGKMYHPYFADRGFIEKRIIEINNILGVK